MEKQTKERERKGIFFKESVKEVQKLVPTIRLSYTILHFGVRDYVIKVQFLLAIPSRTLQLVVKTLD